MGTYEDGRLTAFESGAPHEAGSAQATTLPELLAAQAAAGLDLEGASTDGGGRGKGLEGAPEVLAVHLERYSPLFKVPHVFALDFLACPRSLDDWGPL
jgi:hypothetical protein